MGDLNREINIQRPKVQAAGGAGLLSSRICRESIGWDGLPHPQRHYDILVIFSPGVLTNPGVILKRMHLVREDG